MTLRPVSPILASCISSHRLVPSRVRSPTPANTRVTAVGRRDAGDQLGENDRLAETGPAEQPGLAAADERREQVDHLDARFEQFGLGRKIAKGRRVAVDRPVFFGIDRAAAVDRVARDVEHAAERALCRRAPSPARPCRGSPGRGPGRRCCPARRSARGRRPGAAALRR